MKTIGLFLLCCGCLVADMPTARELVNRVHEAHPRLFWDSEGVGSLRKRALTVLKDDFAALKQEVEGYPSHPRLEFLDDVCEVNGKKITFKRLLNDQNACCYAVRTTGGAEALKCALAYRVTGEESYRQKALAFIRMNVSFIEYCHASRILYEWFHFSRLNAIIAYDWLADTLTCEERRELMLPMLKHVDFMRNPGFLTNVGGFQSGNYGERALCYYVGLATLNDGIDDALAQKLLKEGYRHFVAMMDYRDKISGGSGVLASICACYSFGAYPDSSFNFLRTLKSAAGVDGRHYWTQLSHYANWYLWVAIQGKDGLYEYGFGDTFHRWNELPTWKMYTHMAQIVDLYGDDPKAVELARCVMGILPKKDQVIKDQNLPLLRYVLTGFRPDSVEKPSVDKVLGGASGAFFRRAGLAVMRSSFSPSGTYAAFKAGARFSNHQHYDENTFVIYRGGYQALDTGSRGAAPHHRLYYPQTVAHNGILIRQEKEPLPHYWYPANGERLKEPLYHDGGQNRMQSGRNLGFCSHGEFVATGGDATACYAAEKCREATRVFVFVKPDYVVVYDRVESVTENQDKVFLLHFNEFPRKLGEHQVLCEAGDGCLRVQTLLPERAKTAFIGGEGHEFWTNGKNYLPALYQKFKSGVNWLGSWRMEVTPVEPVRRTEFLHFLQVGDRGKLKPVSARCFREENLDCVSFETADGRQVEMRFRRNGRPGGTIRITAPGRILVNQELFQPLPAEKAPLKHAVRIDLVPQAEAMKLSLVDWGEASLAETPRWLKGGRGALAQFNANENWRRGDVELHSEGTGDCLLVLRGEDARDGQGKRLEKWVEFSSVKVNGRELLSSEQGVAVWHNAPVTLKTSVNDGEKLSLCVRYRAIERHLEK